MRRVSFVILATAALLVAPSTATGATQIGQTFAPTEPCNNPTTTWLQGESPGSQYAAPANGVITRWSFQADAAPPDMKFKVARRGFGSNFLIVGESPLQEDLAPNALNSFPVRIPVAAGDVIGFFLMTPGSCRKLVDSDAGYRIFGFPSDVPPGTIEDFFDFGSIFQLDVAALLEPDCDGDGYGDETQDNIAICAPPAPARALGGTPLTCRGQPATVVGTIGADLLVGTPSPDGVVALAGNDKAIGLDGNDVLCGGPGRDRLKGGKGFDALLGQGGIDTLKGGPGRDVCKGGKGDDAARKCEVEKSV